MCKIQAVFSAWFVTLVEEQVDPKWHQTGRDLKIEFVDHKMIGTRDGEPERRSVAPRVVQVETHDYAGGRLRQTGL